MADIRINALATTAASTASDDFIAVDGSANGTRKLNAFSPTFGGNLTVSGSGKVNADLSITGGLTAHQASKMVLAQASASQSRIYCYGSDTSNVGSFDMLLVRSDGSSAITALSITQSANATLAGNLTVSGTGTSSFGGVVQVSNTLAAKETNASLTLQPGPGTGGINYAFGQGTGDHVWYAGTTERMRLGYGGNLLIGTTTDGGQKLQVSGSAALAGDLLISTNSVINFTVHDAYLRSAGGKSIFLQPAGTTALTLDSSQNATFAGKVTATRLIANSQWVAASAGTGALSATANAGVQLTGTGAVNDITLVNKNGDNVMVVPTGTTNATFAGAIAIGNTVQTAAAVASTHKVTISIGGSTYYLLATNV